MPGNGIRCRRVCQFYDETANHSRRIFAMTNYGEHFDTESGDALNRRPPNL